MTISRVRCFSAGGGDSPDGWTSVKPFLLVKVEAADGQAGWGEAYSLSGRGPAVAALTAAMGEALTGTPAAPRAFRRAAVADFGGGHGGLDFYAAVSAIELALWDLEGKRLGLPVHRLLGGPLRRRIPLYANLWSDREPSAEAMAARAQAMTAEGFRAIKAYPVTAAGPDAAEACLARIRSAVGRETAIMVDLYGLEDAHLALQLGRRFAAYDLFWFEEPVASDQLEVLAEIRRQTGLRIVSGEREGGKARFRDILEARAADVLNPDICGAGGLLEFLEIAALAEAFRVGISPHCYNTMSLGLAAMLQAAALVPNLVACEYFPAFRAASEALVETPIEIRDGQAMLPEGPGLGVTVKEAALTPL